MKLALTEDQELLRDSFAPLFATESSPERVRAAEASGFDPALWKQLAETGAIGIRASEACGGAASALFDAVVLAELAGRHLVSGPLCEAIAVASGLSLLEDAGARAFAERAIEGSAVVSLAMRPNDGAPQVVHGGSIADAVVVLDGDALVVVERSAPPPPLANLGSAALGWWALDAGPDRARTVVARGDAAHAAWERMREEWRLLMAAALGGLGHRAVEIGAAYASERVQFGRLIATFQAIAHPLADAVSAVEGGQLLVWRAVEAIGSGDPRAGGLVAAAFGWLATSVPEATECALHTHGGYGLSLEYDIQLFHRRARTWSLLAGDPRDAFVDTARRLHAGANTALPEAGEVPIDFSFGAAAEAFRHEVRAFLEAHPASEEIRSRRHSFAGHDPAFHRAMAEAHLLFAAWPPEYGGQSRDPYEMSALHQEMERAGRTVYTVGTTAMVAESIMKFGTEDLKREVLPRVAGGEAIISLGYTEPGSGSDVAAAQTRAVRDGDEWVIDGQKMFTSGADIGDYVFLLTRTNTEVRKHDGLTMFLVPLDTPGLEIQPIHTLSDERTNATYYTNVRLPDRYRVGEVDGGWAVIGYALELEHNGAKGGGSFDTLQQIAAVAEWARRRERDGRPAIEDPRLLEGLGYVSALAQVIEALAMRATWCSVERQPNRGQGPMAAAFRKRATVEAASLLMELTAPESVLKRDTEGTVGNGELEFGYRLGTALAIYGGTAEILKSIVAQAALGMPRSRS